MQNMVPGCSARLGSSYECGPFNLTAYHISVTTGARVVGITVGIQSNGTIEIGPEGGIVPGDASVHSSVMLHAKDVDVHGIVRASTIDVTADRVLNVSDGATLSASGLGYQTGAGPRAGASSRDGGGGGGHQGTGDDACAKDMSDKTLARGGGKLPVGGDEWVFGSGGGAGNPIAQELAVMGNEGR